MHRSDNESRKGMSSCCGGPPGFVGAVEAACVSIKMMGKYSPFTYESKAELCVVSMDVDRLSVFLPIVYLGHRLHDAGNEVLHEEVTMLGLQLAVLNPLHPLSDTVFVQSKHKYLALHNAT
jgi:hypothetical protein